MASKKPDVIISEDELLDIVNEQDEVIGSQVRKDAYAGGKWNFRAINVFIKNSKGQLWIPRRVATKKLFPLCFDTSVGGHVAHGESYEFALERELFEELGIHLHQVSYKEIGHCSPHEHGMKAFMKVYEIALEEVPYFNPDDVIEAYWFYPQELLKRIDQGEKSKDDLPRLVKLFYSE